jgi:hypothetical protein
MSDSDDDNDSFVQHCLARAREKEPSGFGVCWNKYYLELVIFIVKKPETITRSRDDIIQLMKKAQFSRSQIDYTLNCLSGNVPAWTDSSSTINMAASDIRCGRAEYVKLLVDEKHSDEAIHAKLRELDHIGVPKWDYWYKVFPRRMPSEHK